MGEYNKFRIPRSHFRIPISESSVPNPSIPYTGCKASISSIILSTFSSTTVNDKSTVTLNKKKNSTSATFRSLGCTSSASSNVSVPEAIGSSVGWSKKKTRKKNNKKKSRNNRYVAEVEDVWGGSEIEFSDDIVVARINAAPSLVNHNQREPSFVSTCPEPEIFDTSYFGHAQHPLPRGLAEIMMLKNNLLMGGRLNMYDQFHNWRLDVDNMSYEELLDLSDRIGYVSTGLREDEISQCVRKTKYSNDHSSHLSKLSERKCTICQDEFQADDDLGNLNCGHSHHLSCIKRWLAHKNACPVCKSVALVRH